jgi:hypothetical protein
MAGYRLEMMLGTRMAATAIAFAPSSAHRRFDVARIVR